MDKTMKRTLILLLMAASCAFAQEKGNVIYHSASVGGMAFGGFDRAPIQGAPYSATITNESIQTLADGNRIAQASTEDLVSQTMEGVLVNGVRTTHTIPAGQIGNERPIAIVSEIWTSPDLKTVVFSKRTDPRMGEQTFRLTNIVRAEPDPSLFTVPPDFKIVEGPQPIRYHTRE